MKLVQKKRRISSQSKMNTQLPQHVGIIMDGNGRWAIQRRHHRIWGHIKGSKTAKRIVEAAVKIGLKNLTLFAFSTENWKRSDEEVNALMKLLLHFLKKERGSLIKQNIKLQWIGSPYPLPINIQKEIDSVIEASIGNTGLNLIIAFNYGSRQEIIDTVKRISKSVQREQIKIEDINEDLFSSHLWTSGTPDPDLIIRTSEENRLSNFLLWQSAYTEFVTVKTLWPDFTQNDFLRSLNIFKTRKRRFGQESQPMEVECSH